MKKINFLIIILLFSITFAGCKPERERVKVTYLVTNSNTGFNVSYQGENAEIIKKDVVTNSKDTKWRLSFYANQGDFVYLSVLDTEAGSYVKAMVMIDEKVYKQASRTNDTTMPVVVSGIIPF